MTLSRTQQKEIAEELLSRFNPDEFESFLKYELDKELYDIATGNFRSQVFQVVDKASRYGWIDELLDAAAKENPEVEPLAARYREAAKRSQKFESPDRDRLEPKQAPGEGPPSSSPRAPTTPYDRLEGEGVPPTELPRKLTPLPSVPSSGPVPLTRQDVAQIESIQRTLANYLKGYWASEDLFDTCAKARSKLSVGQDRPSLMEDKSFWNDLRERTDPLTGYADRVDECRFFPEQVESFRRHVTTARSLIDPLRNLAPGTDPQKLSELAQAVEDMWSCADKLRRGHKDGSEKKLEDLTILLRRIIEKIREYDALLGGATDRTTASAETASLGNPSQRDLQETAASASRVARTGSDGATLRPSPR